MSQISNSLPLGKIAQFKPKTKLAKPKAKPTKPEAKASERPSGLARPAKSQIVKTLRQKIRRTETASRNDDGAIVSSGSPVIDSLLPAGGYHRGTIVEWIADPGSSADFLSLNTARQAALDGGALVVVDSAGQFYPPAAAALGINLGNLILLRETTAYDSRVNSPAAPKQLDADDFLWAIDQSLRCPAVAAVWGHLPEFENSLTRERWLRRFQLSAESSGCLGLFVQPLQQLGKPSWAETQWLVQGAGRIRGSGKYCRTIELKLARCRGAQAGQTITLDINTLSGNIHETPQDKTAIDSNINRRSAQGDLSDQGDTTRRSDQPNRLQRPLRPSRALSVAAKLAHSTAGRRQARA